MPPHSDQSDDTSAPGFKLSFGAATHVGLVRKENQDRLGFVSLPESRCSQTSRLTAGDLASNGTFDATLFLTAVADGMGGHRGGATAAEIAINSALTHSPDFVSDPGKALHELFVHAHREMAECISQQPALAEMGSTLSVALYLKGVIWTAHVGDSRIYLRRSGHLLQISEDHSLVQELVRSRVITPQMAEKHPDRNIITRALSGISFAPPDLYDPIPAQAGDVLLLCTDGLWGMVKEAEINRLAGSLPPQEAADKLVESALNQGGVDNIAVVILRIEC
ncbi:MAG: protein phosphatase 2C domain-containing protein [Calditrichota bacterium]